MIDATQHQKDVVRDTTAVHLYQSIQKSIWGSKDSKNTLLKNSIPVMTPYDKQTLSASDPILGEIIATIPEPHIESTQDVFHDLMSCILEQQIHYRSTKKVFQKMLGSAHLERLTTDNFHQFEEKAFAHVKLAVSKYDTIVNILAFWKENKIDWHLLKDEEVIEKLSAIKGVGKWTIDMILLYTLQRPTVFPYDDFHLKHIMVSLYGLNPNAKLKAQMIEISHTWGEHTSLAVKYLLAWKQFNKTKK